MLTDADIEALRREFGDQFRNLTEEQWRDLAALLPARSKGRKRDIKGGNMGGRSTNFMARKRRELAALMPPGSKRPSFFRMFAAAANYYWKNSGNPRPVKDFRRQLATVIEVFRANLDTLSKLAPGCVEELSKIKAGVDALQKKSSDLQYDADFYEGKPFHKREFVLSALLLWVYCGGKNKFSRPSSNEYSSQVMRVPHARLRASHGSRTVPAHISGGNPEFPTT